LLVVIGVLTAVGIEAGHHAPRRIVPAATTTLPSTTTSLPQAGPDVVPNVLGFTALQAASALQAVDLTNSIDNQNCPGSVGNGEVMGQDPPAGFHAAFDSRVNLRISCDGLGIQTTTMIPG
jgi:hypothetical protein